MSQRVRVLYSFPNKLGGSRICYTAWQQINGLAAAGADVLAFPASSCRPLPSAVAMQPTLARGKLRIPFRLLGKRRARFVHDYIVARRIEKLAGQIDIIHTWPSGARQTLMAAARLGIPTVLERCNSHTRHAFEVVDKECRRLGICLPPDYEGAGEDALGLEEEEFGLADRLLCPSPFVVRTFLDKGFPEERLARHMYGFDDSKYFPAADYQPNKAKGLRMLFVGVCSVRKGLHFALEAWLRSSAHRNGTFTIVGEFLPDYAKKLAPMLSHPSVRALGHRKDVPELMRNNEVLVLPSIEEGSPLVCSEAIASGCVPLVSDICTDPCRHMLNALVHNVGDVEALAQHITLMDEDRELLQALRAAGLNQRSRLTWQAAGLRLLEVYRETISMHSQNRENHSMAICG